MFAGKTVVQSLFLEKEIETVVIFGATGKVGCYTAPYLKEKANNVKAVGKGIVTKVNPKISEVALWSGVDFFTLS